MKGSVLFLTWDEGTSDLGGGGRIATVVIGPTIKQGYRSTTPHTHYSLLRTIETAWNLGCLNKSCAANTRCTSSSSRSAGGHTVALPPPTPSSSRPIR